MKYTRILAAIVLIFALFRPGLSVSAAEAGLQDGDRVVIWSEKAGMAVSSETKSGNRAGVEVSMADGVLTGYTEREIWTVERAGEGWRFLQNGQALSLAAGNYNLRLDAVNDCWILEAGEDGTYLLKNTGRNLYLTYSTSRRYWTGGTTGTAVRMEILPREEVPERPSLGGYSLYFGQLHAHTDLSDGTGSVEEAFQYASQVEGLDFFAVTDHSQSFDNAENASLTQDASLISKDWARGKAAAEAVTDGDFVGIFGFEMTWNQGQGHMSTFNTPGFLSRDQENYQSYASGMENYYTALLEAPDSVSQFNHPGDADGDFKDFAGYSGALDARITLIEVGSGTDAYDRALGKGWHLAPTNNQNNHAGHWGDESGARTVVLAETLTEQAIYDALSDYRVYATEDADLAILYTLDGHIMGERIPAAEVGETVTLTANLSDPTGPVGTVSVITENGTVLAEDTVSGSEGTVTFSLTAKRPYYYLRINQPDGDVAVTAPIWLDSLEEMGIRSLEPGTPMTTAGESQTFRLTLYNDEEVPMEITSVTFSAEETHWTAQSPGTLAPYDTAVCEFFHTFPLDGVYAVTAEVMGRVGEQTRTFTQTLQVKVMPPALVDDVILDATHGSHESFAHAVALAEQADVDLILAQESITPDLLDACRVLIIPAPEQEFEAAFLTDVKDYVNRGGDLILCCGSAAENAKAAETINGLLQELGLSLRANADVAVDPLHNAGTADRLYTTVFSDSPWLEDLTQGQRYEQFSGCTVTGGSWLVKGMDAESVLLAAEKTHGGGTVSLAGGNFMEDVHINGTQERWALPTANQTLLETILDISHSPQEIIPLKNLRTAEQDRCYLAEGRVTAGTANPNTTFENTIYIQDDSGAIAASPYSTHGLALGTRVRILGTLTSQEENPTLNILRLEVLGSGDVVAPAESGNDISADRQGGQLLKLQGTVIAAEQRADGAGIARFRLEDAVGNQVTVLVEDYILSGSQGKNNLARIVVPGNQVSAVGLVHGHQGETVLRLRDCDEVKLLWSPAWEDGDGESEEDPSGTTPEETPGAGDTDPSQGTEDEEDDPSGTDPEGDDSGEDGKDPDINPGTGDRTGIGGYFALAILSLLGMAALLWQDSRRLHR